MKSLAIKTRVTLYYTLMMVIVVALVLVFMVIVGRSVIANNAEATLLDVVHDNIDDVEYKNGFLDLDELNLYRHNVYILVYDDLGQLIGGTGLRQFEGSEEFRNGETREISVNGDEYLVYDLYVRHPEGNVWLRGITSTENSSSAVRVILILSLILFPVLVVLTAVGGYFIARHALKPVTTITETANAITDGEDLTARIGLRRGKDEIHRLAATFDRMFDRLERSFDSQKRFVSDASHELRTPTAVILAECDYAKQNAKTVGDYRESLEVVERQAKKMSSLINQLLGITRMDQGTERLSLERANFTELTDIVCDELVLAGAKDITLERSLEPEVYAVMDVGLMTRLVQNLVENAFKYTPEGGSVRVSLKSEGEMLKLSVADNGIGISAKDLPRVWDRFYRADTSRGVSQGSGLGLSIVKQISDAHGGTLSVKSKPGVGSTFIFAMPQSRQSKEEK